jgi:putative hydrolase of the HAD superfamily
MPELPVAVTFDCWNTLLAEEDWPEAHRRRVDTLLHAARDAGAQLELAQASAAFDAAWQRHQELWAAGVSTGARHVAEWAMRRLGAATEGAVFEVLVAHFEHSSHSGRVVPLAGAVETVERLREAGIACALICDTGLTPGHVVRQHLLRVGLLRGLRAQIFSDEVGAPKPDARMFRAALAALGCPAREALHVGDLRRTDVAGARAAGMRSVRIRAAHDDLTDLPEADHVVASHTELCELLGIR